MHPRISAVNRFLILLLGLAIGAIVVVMALRLRSRPDLRADGDVRAAYARALAFYRNETNADDRRARMELAPFGGSHGENPAWLLDMALIDLAEIHHPVQSQDHILGEPSNYVLLLQSAMQRLERARALAPDDDSIAFNLARTWKRRCERERWSNKAGPVRHGGTCFHL